MELLSNNYQKSLNEIQQIIVETRQKIEQEVNYYKILMGWNIGKIIQQHLKENQQNGYKNKFFEQLANDTSISTRVLYQMQNFYHTYPTLPTPDTKLSWSQYCHLSTIKNPRSRLALEKKVVEKNLSANELLKEIKQRKRHLDHPTLHDIQLDFKRGQIFTYEISKLASNNQIYFDCGFNIFGAALNQNFKEGAIVASTKTSTQFRLEEIEIEKSRLHTYKAYVDKVVDGDTLNVTLDLGFNIKHKEIIRLAKINAPEKDSQAGEQATKKLQEILRNTEFVIIKTHKTDIYGRYIGDVFFSPEHELDPQRVADEGTYLNQLLLDYQLVEIY
ncbi:MAG: thermonuclease family protein [Rickettsiales bacterium]|nr:thermonuclease family protein [Rickettsiales bacterium]